MTSKTINRRLFAGVLLLLVAKGALAAQPNPLPGSVLTVTSGKAAQATQQQFDLPRLKQLPQSTFTTRTPWDRLPVKFTGPLLRDVLAAAKAKGSMIYAVAANDYKVAIPWADAEQYGVIVALSMNDQPIPRRTLGPLFVVYPFDATPELAKPIYADRSIWQLKWLDVQ